MLSEEEKMYAKELLEMIPTLDIMQVAAVSTDSSIEINSREDAIKSILLHETSSSSLLSRKKITKSVLFKYLHKKEISCDGSSDKVSLCNFIINFWNKSKGNQVNENVVEATSVSDHNNSASFKSAPDVQPNTLENAMAQQFCTWFYALLNEEFLKTGGPTLTENDFWPDCQASIIFPDSPQSSSQSFSSSTGKDTLMLLSSLRSQYDLYFSPNLTLNGVKARYDPHGLVIVTACGTLHSRAGDCVGVFEQMFGLIADPLTQNNYKMKRVSLNLKTMRSETPAILNS